MNTTTDKYILDAEGNPQPEPDLHAWGQWLQNATNRIVKKERIDDSEVSTVFLGIDHSFGGGLYTCLTTPECVSSEAWTKKSANLTLLAGVVTLWDILMNELSPIGHRLCVNFEPLVKWHNHYAYRIRRRGNTDGGLDEDECRALGEIADGLEDAIKDLNLKLTNAAIAELKSSSRSWSVSWKDGVHLAGNIQKMLVAELQGVKFLRATAGMEKYLGVKHPFGEIVKKAFTDCYDDLYEAHQCFALERYTACVFHLGRVMERSAAKLAKKLKVYKPGADWQDHLKAIDAAIAAMPYKPRAAIKKRAAFLEASEFSFRFKEVWRNPTAHPERSYTPEQAMDIINSCRAFMQAVATKIFKVKP